MDSKDIEIGGDHYKKLKYQPKYLISKLELDFFQGNVVKYVSRYKNKNGEQDLKKLCDYGNMVKELSHTKPYKLGDKRLREIDVYCKENGFTNKHIKYILLAICSKKYNLLNREIKALFKADYGKDLVL